MSRPSRPSTTYRLQLHARFTFADATRILPYLDAVGITHVYTSPFLKASPGSLHGYDICDHAHLNPDLGTTEDFERFTGELHKRGMGLILDFVPNHMGLDPNTNPWWRSVLTHGPSSPYAAYFDIDWHPLTRELEERVLLPMLQGPYGDVLERGDIKLSLNDGELTLVYFENRLPVEPKSAVLVLRLALALPTPDTPAPALATLARIAADLEALPPYTETSETATRKRVEMAADVRVRLSQLCTDEPLIRERMTAALTALNGVAGEPWTFDRLHTLLDAQPYRLAYWRAAFDEINYRRFFDINGLGGLRMENPETFDAAHRFVIDLIRRGTIQGLRIDHPDGLFDPGAYFVRLQQSIADATDASSPFFVAAEKILADGERLPESWPIAGTTGYGFLNVVNGLFVDSMRAAPMTRAYRRLTAQRDAFADVAYHSKRLIMSSSMASELNVLVHLLKDLATRDRHTRDFTANALRRAIVETVACFPVYRTYVSAAGTSAADRDAIDFAIDLARRRNPVIPSALFLFLRNVLLATEEQAASRANGDEWIGSRRHFAMKFQQFSAPVFAKGVEDTAFYRDAVLLSLNEVGGDPGVYGHNVETFHAGNRVRLESWPLELLASSTHDTKRGEDARARLNVLSEMPAEWPRAVASWMRINIRRRSIVDRQPAPDRLDEYIFYQSLVGAWPAEPIDAPVPAEAPPDLVARLQTYMYKVAKEAKRHTSWIGGNSRYEDAIARFVETTLSGTSAASFLARFVPFARRVASAGMVNSLAQTTLKFTAPGVSDTYQGSELWNLDLADPDNRRPVDFDVRETMMRAIEPCLVVAEAAVDPIDSHLEKEVAGWLSSWTDGRIKLFVTARLARWRRQNPALFLDGDYVPLHATGPRAANVVAFARIHQSQRAIVVVPRLTSGKSSGPDVASFWENTALTLPEPIAATRLRHGFTGAIIESERDESGTSSVPLSTVFRTLPVAVLTV